MTGRVTEIPSTHFPDTTHIEVGVSYGKGGMNMFTYRDEPRGYSLFLRAIKVEESPFGRSVSFMMFTTPGARFFLKDAARLDRKRFARLEDALLPHAAVFAGHLERDDKEAIRTLAADLTVGIK